MCLLVASADEQGLGEARGADGASARKGGSCPWPFSSDLKEGEENEEEVGHHLGPPGRRRSPHLETPGAGAAWKPGQQDPCSWRQGPTQLCQPP